MFEDVHLQHDSHQFLVHEVDAPDVVQVVPVVVELQDLVLAPSQQHPLHKCDLQYVLN